MRLRPRALALEVLQDVLERICSVPDVERQPDDFGAGAADLLDHRAIGQFLDDDGVAGSMKTRLISSRLLPSRT